MSFCARGKFWEKEPHTHSPPPLSVVGVSNIKYLHKVTVKISLTVPGKDIGQTHSGSLEGKSTITAWKLAPRWKYVKQVTIVTVPPYPCPFLTLSRDVGFHHQLVPSSREVLFAWFWFLDFISVCCLFSLVGLRFLACTVIHQNWACRW